MSQTIEQSPDEIKITIDGKVRGRYPNVNALAEHFIIAIRELDRQRKIEAAAIKCQRIAVYRIEDEERLFVLRKVLESSNVSD